MGNLCSEGMVIIMSLQKFCDDYDLTSKVEREKVAYLAYFFLQKEKQDEFSVSDVVNWFKQLHFPKPNTTRLAKNLAESSDFMRGISPDVFRLHAKIIKRFQTEMPKVFIKSKEVESDGNILPNSLLEGKRNYIQLFGKQINSAYSNNIFDGCAVLMRRMVEICLILTYENFGIDSQIKIGLDKYKDLKEIIKDAVSNPDIKLTKDSRECVDEFRDLGNLSAHKLYYNCKHEEIDRLKVKFRLLIEELFNKAGRMVEK